MNDLDDIRGEALVVFAKAAIPGRAKTRLGASIGDERAADVYRGFMADLAELVAKSAREADDGVVPLVAHAGHPDHDSYAPFRGRDFEFVEQGDGSLGDRLERVSSLCFSAGAERVVVIGSDSPTIRPDHLSGARDALREVDVVIGPSFDGGYWLLGSDAFRPSLFRDVDWSTPRVLRQTLAGVEQTDASCRFLEFWYDVDTFDDLRRLRTHLLDYLVEHDRWTPSTTSEKLRQMEADGVFARASKPDG